MTHFEYIAVIVSIILGLSIVRILGSLEEVFSKQRYWPHAVWIITFFWIQAQNWWAFWEMRTISFNLLHYAVWIAFVSLLYLSTVSLTNKTDETRSWKTHYYDSRKWFFSVMVIMLLAGIFLSVFFFGTSLLHPYRIVQGSCLLLAVAGLVSDKERVHEVISVLFLLFLIFGVSLFRFLPDLMIRST